MNPYRQLLSQFGWDVSPSHENYRWVYLLFVSLADALDNYNALATAHSLTLDANVYDDPAREVLRRLDDYDGAALVSIKQLLSHRIK